MIYNFGKKHLSGKVKMHWETCRIYFGIAKYMMVSIDNYNWFLCTVLF